MHIYLDETGTLTKSDGKYFIVASFSVDDSRKLEKAFRKWQSTKFPKKLRGQAEIKFNDAHITDKLRLNTITYLAKQNIHIFYTYLHTKDIPYEYCKDGKVHESGLLYAAIVQATIELYLPLSNSQLTIIRDRRTLKGMSSVEFHERLKIGLSPKLPQKTLFQIEAVDSTTSTHVQVADWICGALGRFYDKKINGDKFYHLLKKNIMKETELFSDRKSRQKKT